MSERVPTTNSLVGRVFQDRYQVLSLLGEGGMGAVWLARRLDGGENVALKVIRADQRGNETTVRRFLREMRATSKIQHPNTIAVHDFGETTDGELFLVMELLKGRTLLEAMDQGPIEPERAVKIARQIARALAAAHGEGLIHRDLKPENVMLVHGSDGQEIVKVLDFGIVRVANPTTEFGRSALTAQGLVLGTPLYMAPEQITETEFDHRVDLYSLGIVLFYMLAGRPPFEGSTPVRLLYDHVNTDPPTFAALGLAGVPPALEDLVQQLLRKDPAQRPSSAEHVAESLANGRSATPAPVGRVAAPESRNRWTWVAGAVVAVAVTLGVVGLGLAVIALWLATSS